MEEFIALLIPALLALILLRLLILPIRLLWKLGLHVLFGFACLWLLNLAAPVTGILFPINAVTTAIAGFLGIPGIGVMALLAVL